MEVKENNTMRSMTKSHFQDTKLDKSKELNSSMSIQPKPADEYTTKIKNLGGNN